MAAKIILKNGNIGNFGGFFSTFDSFDKIGLSELIDNSLKNRDIRAKYSYSDIIKNLIAIYFSGGDAIEDINIFRNETYTKNPEYRFCSADTILKSLTELQVDNDTVESKSGKKYQFNINEELNKLLFKCLLKCNLVKAGDIVTLDYDNQLIPTEKLDATYSYKKVTGYFPGITQINLHPCHIECRDGNANVKLDYEEIADNQWIDAEIDYQKCQLASLPFTAFLSERNYRLVVQRTLVPSDKPTLFDSYIYHFGVFMILAAIARNFFVSFLKGVARLDAFRLKETSRVKRFVFRFMSVPFKWVRRGRQWLLTLYSAKPYDKLLL